LLFLNMFSFFKKITTGKIIKELEYKAALINHEEQKLKNSSDEELKNLSLKLRERILGGESEDLILSEAFALVRETSLRTLKQRHYDVQLMGGIVLHEGKIAEMLTGEGKTLVATLPVYLNALSGKGVHIVTVNDYLAKRDAVWMGQIYYALGLSVSCIVHDESFLYDPAYTQLQTEKLDAQRDAIGGFKVFEEFLRPISRKEAYAVDITYGTNHEFGFDYLKDNLTIRLADKVQREHYYAIIDEIDSILIDEARTPLIISAPDAESSGFYKIFSQIVAKLNSAEDYETDEKLKVVNITNSGIEKTEKMLGVENIYAPENSRLVHFLQESLKARALFQRDRDYVVKNNEIIIVDEFTGRMLPGRRYSQGLHQAIEAKENVPVQQENRTYAQITIQNYFRLYKKIAGMTGTAQTSAEEFHKVYNLEVVSIPPNKKMARTNLPDFIYKSKETKYQAVAKEVKSRHLKGQPVLLGTTSITNNEIISEYLKKAGIPHEILNAKNHEREGEIIAQAGKPGAVTVATNMAGRGVDIILGGNPPLPDEANKVREVGGLHIIGTERHEARRIDNQLRGRSGRQGDPGSSQFFLSLEDDLLRIFGGERVKNLMQSLNFPDDVPIESSIVSNSVNQAQQKVEGANFDLRRHLLDFDDVLNKQRAALYAKRDKFLSAGDKNEIIPLVQEIINNFISVAEKNLLAEEGLNIEESEKNKKELESLKEKSGKVPESVENERAIMISQFMVKVLDTLWIAHLENLESLRESVNIRAYGQHEPIVEYRRDAFKLFQELNHNFEGMVFQNIFPIFELDLTKTKKEFLRPFVSSPRESALGKIGRNDPCYCGSGKKYKKCHGQ